MTLKINRNSGKAPREVVDQIVSNRTFPITVKLTHKNVLPIVLPSSGINTALPPDVEHAVKIKSHQQAWLLVTDLSEYAARAGSDADDFGVLNVPPVPKTGKPAAQATQEPK